MSATKDLVKAVEDGHESGDKKAVADILQKVDPPKVISALSTSLLSSSDNPAQFLRHCLSACRVGGEDSLRNLRTKIASKSLSLLMRNDFLSASAALAIMDAMAEDLDEAEMDPADGLRLLGECRDEIRDNGDGMKTRWFRYLGLLLASLSCRDKVDLEGAQEVVGDEIVQEVSGAEFRSRMLSFLCALDWPPVHAAAFCALFRELDEGGPRLSPAERACAVTRLCAALRHLEPQELPPLVHQMLGLCRDPGAAGTMLRELANCFVERLAKSSSSAEEEESLESAELIGEVGEGRRCILQAEGTIMVHLMHAVRIAHPVHKDVVKWLRQAANMPESILEGQFWVYLALSLSSLPAHRSTVVDALKAAVSKSVAFGQRQQREGWLRKAMSPSFSGDGDGDSVSVAFCLLVEDTSSYQGWDLVGGGFVDLAFALLDAKALLGGRPDTKLKAIWKIGTDIISKIFRCCSSSVRTVLPMLVGRLKSSQAAPQYVSCLKRVVKDSLALCMENASLMTDLVDRIHTLGVNGAERTLEALLPLIKVSRSLRDATILTLRKSLFDRSNEVKQIGMKGVLQLLQVFKITTALPVTQLSQSSGNLTQFSSELLQGSSSASFSSSSVNVALCSMLVSALQKGLSQTPAVRLIIYSGLYEAVARNPELCSDVLAVLHEHAVDMGWAELRRTEDGGGLVDLDPLIEEENAGVVIKDPAGWYFHCAQQLLTKSEELYGGGAEDMDIDGYVEDENATRTRNWLSSLLEEMCRRYSEADLTDLNFDKTADYSKATVVGSKNVWKADLVKNLLEALMDYLVMHGADVDEDKARKFVGLFKRHQEVSALLKGANGPPKAPVGGGKKKKKKADDEGSNDSSQSNNNAQTAGLMRQKKNAFKMPEHAHSIRTLAAMLRAIVLDRDDSHAGALAVLRGDGGDLAVHLAHVLQAKLAQADRALAESGDDSGNQLWLRHARAAGKLCMECLMVGDDLAAEVAERREVLALECCESLCLLLNMMATHFSAKLQDFMTKLVEDTSSDISGSGLPQSLGRLCDAVFDLIASAHARSSGEEVDAARAAAGKKVVGAMVRILLFVASNLDCRKEEDAAVMKKMSDWSREFGESFDGGTSPEVLNPYLELLFSSARALRESSNLTNEIATQLRSVVGDIDANTSSRPAATTFPFVTVGASESILRAICSHVVDSMDSADAFVGWCRQRYQNRQEGKAAAAEEKFLRQAESEVCHLLGRTVHTVKELCQSCFRTECLLDHSMRVAARLYGTLCLLAKHFFVRTRQSRDCVEAAKFDHLVNLVGKSLTVRAYELITHTQDLSDEETGHRRGGQGGHLRSRVQKESKGIPNLVFRIEAFENEVIKLGARCKINLMEKTRISANRDFRIKMDEFRRLQESGARGEDAENDPSADGHAAESTAIEDEEEDGDGEGEDLRLSSTTQNSVLRNVQLHSQQSSSSSPSSQASSIQAPPPAKRLKVKMAFNKPKKT